MAGNRILYVVVTEPGGIDGMDRHNKGGDKFASFSEADAKRRVTNWDRIEARVVDVDQVLRAALAKLTPTERAALQAVLPSA